MSKKWTYITGIKWLVLLAAYGYLAYLLFSFNQYNEIWTQWKQSFSSNWSWLLFVLILLPLNWALETKKWQVLIEPVEKLSFKSAFKSVMGGNTAAFFSPNRIGEFPGRSVFLSKGNKMKGILLGSFGSLSQTLVILLCGLPAFVLFVAYVQKMEDYFAYQLWASAAFVSIIVTYFFLPSICLKLSKYRWTNKIHPLLVTLARLEKSQLTRILLLAFVRYIVFCVQLYFMLRFLCIDIEWSQAAIGIATNYLFVTFAPSLAFSEGAVRASSAVLVLGSFSHNTVGIATAGISIWLINFVIPMLFGSYYFSKVRS
jgi:hypothetical protein